MRFRSFLFLSVFLAASVSVFSQNEKWVTFDGNKIRYYDVGVSKAKNAIVLVHCWTCNADFWRDSINAFSGYRVIAMDLPGHGQSDKPKIDYSIDYFARAVDAVMKNAGVKKAVFAGHSMGTPIIRKYYELYPNKTLGLIVVDGALIPFGPRADIDKFFDPLFKDYRNGAANFIDGMLQPADPKVRPFIRESMLATPDYVAQSAMKLMLDDSYATHGTINVPVLAVMAPIAFWPPDLETKYKAIAPKLEFQMWSGVSHFLQMERPAMFNGQVKGFIIRNKLL
jgi:pimeloyl-ACP methyl ester carboxylesterase